MPFLRVRSLLQVRVEIKGVEQGVCYRDWAVEHATELGLNGTRKTVHLKLYSCDKVEEMQQLLGPPWSPASTLFLAVRIPAPAFNADQLFDHL